MMNNICDELLLLMRDVMSGKIKCKNKRHVERALYEYEHGLMHKDMFIAWSRRELRKCNALPVNLDDKDE